MSKLGFKFIVLFIFFHPILGFTQNDFIFRISFKDKIQSNFSIENPQQFLSEKAILRRLKYNIKIDDSDLPVSETYVSSILQATNSVLHVKSKWNNSASFITSDTALFYQKISSFSFIDKSEIVGVYPGGYEKYKNTNTKNKFENIISNQNKNYFDYNNSYAEIHMHRGEFVHEEGFAGENMLIAQLDAGWNNLQNYTAFDSLIQNNRIAGERNIVHPGQSIYQFSTHGCDVLSMMATLRPAYFVGAAPRANYFLILSEDVASEQPIEMDNWAYGAEIADSIGADIINSSLGYNFFDGGVGDLTYNTLNGRTTPCAIAAVAAARKGIIVITSAGNDGNSWNFLQSPADADSILTVGGVSPLGIYNSASCRGNTIDGRIKPDVVATGFKATLIGSSDAVGEANGTSFSAPIIAGLVACFSQAISSNISPWQIVNEVRMSSSNALSPDSLIGWGIPNFHTLMVNHGFTSIASVANNNTSFIVYPNPALDKLYIDFSKSYFKNKNINLKISNLIGTNVFQENINLDNPLFTLENLHLATGTYFLQCSNADKTETQIISIK